MPENTATRILIVDDEELIRGTLVRILEPRGYECVTAADATEARIRLRSEEPELILCDVRMPGESGLDLARALTREYPNTGIVMVSAADDLDTADELFSLGVYGYVVKPFTSQPLLQQIQNVCENHFSEARAA